MIRILFIEETFETREIIKDYFQSEAVPGFSIDFACDMQSGLDKVRAKPYDLLLVDCKPSGEAGLDACRRLRENSSCAIVHVTTMEDEDDVRQGYALSADDYLVKPFSPADLLRTVSEFADKNSKSAENQPKKIDTNLLFFSLHIPIFVQAARRSWNRPVNEIRSIVSFSF